MLQCGEALLDRGHVDAELQGGRCSGEGVEDVMPSDHRSVYFGMLAFKFEQEPPAGAVLCENGAADLGFVAHSESDHASRTVLEETTGCCVVNIDNRSRIGRQIVKQPALGQEIVVRRFVIIEMVLGEIGKDPDGK